MIKTNKDFKIEDLYNKEISIEEYIRIQKYIPKNKPFHFQTIYDGTKCYIKILNQNENS